MKSKFINKLATGAAAVGTVAMPMLAGATGPEDGIVSALGDVSTSALAVVAAAGAIFVTVKIAAGLWVLGANWASRASKGGK